MIASLTLVALSFLSLNQYTLKIPPLTKQTHAIHYFVTLILLTFELIWKHQSQISFVLAVRRSSSHKLFIVWPYNFLDKIIGLSLPSLAELIASSFVYAFLYVLTPCEFCMGCIEVFFSYDSIHRRRTYIQNICCPSDRCVWILLEEIFDYMHVLIGCNSRGVSLR